MKSKNTISLVSPNPESKEDYAGSGYFFTKLLAFCFCCLFISVSCPAQYIKLSDIETFIQKAESETLTPQTLTTENRLLRFNELGKIYNPDFPTTRNKVYVEHYQKNENSLLYIGKSVSTFRATVPLGNRVGDFYCIMSRDEDSAVIAYSVQEIDNELQITGNLYKCF